MKFFLKARKNNISVHGLRNRTTSSLESYNAIIGRIFPKHANFYRFLQILNREISKQSIRFRRAIDGQSYIRLQDKKKIEKSNLIITKCSQRLDDGSYDVGKFLKQIVFLEAIQQTSWNLMMMTMLSLALISSIFRKMIRMHADFAM